MFYVKGNEIVDYCMEKHYNNIEHISVTGGTKTTFTLKENQHIRLDYVDGKFNFKKNRVIYVRFL